MSSAASAGRPALLRWSVIALLALAALWAIERVGDGGRAPAVRDWQDSPFSGRGPPRSYPEALAHADLSVANARAAAAAGRDQWLLHETLAGHYLARARLSGSYDDYAAAERALDDAFDVAVPGSGPHLMRAKLEFAMHRLAPAERQLAAMDAYAVMPDSGERSEMAAMRGDIALYRGRLQDSLDLYDQADAMVPGTADFRRAIHAARTGAADRADAYFVRAQRNLQPATPQSRSFLELQRGILDLDRGRLAEAMAHFRHADRLFPGHWLVEEHIAEVLTLQGEFDRAERLYRDIVRRTGHPEFIDALAGIAEARGQTATARRLHAQAAAIWDRRLKLFPEAAYGHAIDHCVSKRDWPCALRLARLNHQARPYGDSKVALARALLGNGDAAAARAAIEPVLASPWRTVDLHRTAADIYRATGMRAAAAAQDRLARAIGSSG